MSSSWNSSLLETSCTSYLPRPPQFATDDAQLEEKFELELVSFRDKFHLKWKMKEISVSPLETLETLKTLKNSVSLSTLSVSKAEALLSQSQKLKLYSLGLKSWNSTLSVSTLSVSKAETLSVSTLSIPLSPSQLPLASFGDHWKSGKEISLSSPPFNFRNFGFGLGFWKLSP